MCTMQRPTLCFGEPEKRPRRISAQCSNYSKPFRKSISAATSRDDLGFWPAARNWYTFGFKNSDAYPFRGAIIAFGGSCAPETWFCGKIPCVRGARRNAIPCDWRSQESAPPADSCNVLAVADSPSPPGIGSCYVHSSLLGLWPISVNALPEV